MNNCSVENDMIKQSHVMFITVNCNDEVIYWYTDDTIRSVNAWWYSDDFDGPCNDDPLLALYIDGTKIFDYTDLYQTKPDSLRGFPGFSTLFDILKPMEDNDIEVFFDCNGEEYRFFDAANVIEEWKNGILSHSANIFNVKIGDVPVNVDTVSDLVWILDVKRHHCHDIVALDAQVECDEENASKAAVSFDFPYALDLIIANMPSDYLGFTKPEEPLPFDQPEHVIQLPNDRELRILLKTDNIYEWKVLGGAKESHREIWSDVAENYDKSTNREMLAKALHASIAEEVKIDFSIGDEVNVEGSNVLHYIVDVMPNGLRLYNTDSKETFIESNLDKVSRCGHDEMAEKVFS